MAPEPVTGIRLLSIVILLVPSTEKAKSCVPPEGEGPNVELDHKAPSNLENSPSA